MKPPFGCPGPNRRGGDALRSPGGSKGCGLPRRELHRAPPREPPWAGEHHHLLLNMDIPRQIPSTTVHAMGDDSPKTIHSNPTVLPPRHCHQFYKFPPKNNTQHPYATAGCSETPHRRGIWIPRSPAPSRGAGPVISSPTRSSALGRTRRVPLSLWIRSVGSSESDRHQAEGPTSRRCKGAPTQNFIPTLVICSLCSSRWQRIFFPFHFEAWILLTAYRPVRHQ